MASQLPANGRLDGWKAISEYLGWHTRTVMRWEQQKGLPIHRVPGGHRHAVYAFRGEIDGWLKGGHVESGPGEMLEPTTNGTIRSDFVATSSDQTSADNDSPSESALSAASHWLRRNRQRVVWATAVLLLLATGAFILRSLAFPSQLLFTGVVQLTNDGATKEGLVTDGTTLYFGEHRYGGITLSYASVNGGPVHTIPTPFIKATPIDISKNHRELLVSVREGEEEERALWIVPIAGGRPRQVGRIRCHDASWSPDGRLIAFAAQNAIYTTSDEGASIHQIQTFETVPHLLRWSPNGKRLRFDLRDPKTFSCTFWEITLDSKGVPEVETLTPLHLSLSETDAMTLDDAGRSFISTASTSGPQILLVSMPLNPWTSRFLKSPMNREISEPEDLALDPNSKRLFVLAGSGVSNETADAARSELLWLDVHSRQFRPFLSGISAQEVDFSRDGKRAAYVKRPEQSLWVSETDGTGARQIPLVATEFELPRWSPDGKSLAVMVRLEGKPWRIFVVSPDDGRAKEASVGSDNQGAPTWSPDGKWLVYGRVRCQQTDSCSIHKIKLSTGQEFLVPGSEGLGTARWSPDGRFIAALAPDKHEVYVYVIAQQEWRKLAAGINGTDLSWSPDSRFVYARRSVATQPEIIRIRLDGGEPETIINLSSLTRLSGRIEMWFAVAPDGSIILDRGVSANEIYALTFDNK